MPKDWKSIHDELNRRRVSNEEVQRIIDGHTKSKSDLESYIEYTKTTVHQSLTTAPSTTSLVDFISNASLAACDKPEYREWLNKMLHPAQTPIPLGRTTNAFYRFHPNPRELNADDEELEDETAGKHPGYDVVDFSLLESIRTSPPAPTPPVPGSPPPSELHNNDVSSKLPTSQMRVQVASSSTSSVFSSR